MTLAEIKTAATAAPVTTTLRAQVLSRRDEETKEGKKFITLELGDGTGQEKVRLWSDGAAFAAANRLGVRAGAFVGMDAAWVVNKWGLESRQPSLFLLTPMEEAELLAGSPAARRANLEQWKELCAMFAGAQPQPLREFALRTLTRYEDGFRRAAAARGNHHARRGGLLAHTLSMLCVAEGVAACYPEVSLLLLRCGILFHDLGKIYENDYEEKGFKQRPTFTGKLLGHIPIGHVIVANLWRETFGHLYPDTRDHLIHLVLCHHGMKEWGSPQEPMSPEGFCVHYIDMLDARMEILRESYANPDLIPGICDAKKPLYGSVARPWNASAEFREMAAVAAMPSSQVVPATPSSPPSAPVRLPGVIDFPTECRCEKCMEDGLHQFMLGAVDAGIRCDKCGEPASCFLPVVPECPGTDVALTRHADGTLHWDGGTGLEGPPGVEGEPGSHLTSSAAS